MKFDPISRDVFISYARVDQDKALRLHDELSRRNLRPAMDQTELVGGERDYQRRIDELLRHSAKMIFVMTAASAKSHACAEEVRAATLAGIPIVPLRLDETPLDAFPEAIRKAHYIRLSEDVHWDRNLPQIETAIRLNLEWEREKAFYATLAQRGDLLPGRKAVRKAEDWLARRPAHAAAPPEEIFDMVQRSQRTLDRIRKGVVLASVGFVTILALVAGIALLQRQSAEQRADLLTILATENLVDEGEVDLALLDLLDASVGMKDETMPGETRIAFERVLTRAASESRHLVPANTIGFRYLGQMFLIYPDDGQLLRVTTDGPQVLARVEGQFEGLFPTDTVFGPLVALRHKGYLNLHTFDPESGVGIRVFRQEVGSGDIWLDVEPSGVVILDRHRGTDREDTVIANPSRRAGTQLIGRGIYFYTRGLSADGWTTLDTWPNGLAQDQEAVLAELGVRLEPEDNVQLENRVRRCFAQRDLPVYAIEAGLDFFSGGSDDGPREWTVCRFGDPFVYVEHSFPASGGGVTIAALTDARTGTDHHVAEWRVNGTADYLRLTSSEVSDDVARVGFASAEFRDLVYSSLGGVEETRRLPSAVQEIAVLGDGKVAALLKPIRTAAVPGGHALLVIVDFQDQSDLWEVPIDWSNEPYILPPEIVPVGLRQGLYGYSLIRNEVCTDPKWLAPVRGNRPIAPGDRSGLLRVTWPDLRDTVQVPSRYVEAGTCIRLSNDGSWYFALGRENGKGRRLEAWSSTGDSLGVLDLPQDAIPGFGTGPEPHLVIWQPASGSIVLQHREGQWQTKAEIPSVRPFLVGKPVLDAVPSIDGKLVLYTQHDGDSFLTTRLYSVEAGEDIRKLGTTYKLGSAAFLNDGSILYQRNLSPSRYRLPPLAEMRDMARAFLSPHCAFDGDAASASPCWPANTQKTSVGWSIENTAVEEAAVDPGIWFDGTAEIHAETALGPEVGEVMRSAITEIADRYGTLSAMALLVRVEDGAVVAEATHSYAPNGRVTGRTPFEPGSAIKPLTAAIALDMLLIARGAEVEMGPLSIGERTILDQRNRSGGTDTFENAFLIGYNTPFARMGVSIGPEAFIHYLNAFGIDDPFGGKPNISEQEAQTFVAFAATGTEIEFDVYSLAKIYSALGGHCISNQAVFDAEGEGKPEALFDCETTYDIIKLLEMKGEMYELATKSVADFPPFPFSGMAGTAAKRAEDGTFLSDKTIATFASLFPAGELSPNFALIVVLDEPVADRYGSRPKQSGGWTAAPAAAQIIAKLYPVLYPEGISRELAPLQP